MATQIDITASTLLAQKALAPLLNKYPLLSLFSTNFSDDAKGLGQTVNVPVFGTSEGVAKGVKEAIDHQAEADGTISEVTVTLGTRCAQTQTFSAYAVANMSDDAFAKAIETSANATVGKAVAMIHALACTPANHVATTAASATALAYADVRAARLEAAKLGLDMDQLVLVLSAEAYENLVNDDAVTKNFTAVSQAALEAGQIPVLAGMKVVRSAKIPAGYFGYLAVPESIAIAARPFPEIGSSWQQVMTADGGLAITASGKDEWNSGARSVATALAFGCAAVKAGASDKRIVAIKCGAGS